MTHCLKRSRWLASLGVACCTLLFPYGSAVTTAQDKAPPGDRLHQPFTVATIDEAPEGQRLLERTKTNLSVGKLYEQVVGNDGVGGLWEQVKFVSPAGKRLAYTATIKTALGDVVLELWPDVAPNHVRNFVALARAGYYNGLGFDRTELTQVEGQPLECLYAGCPEGTGDAGLGSIGYWMKPELSKAVKHEPGTVGAYHEEEVETAACKFYITLSTAPYKDGEFSVFGKVTQGLDVLRAIRGRPVHQDDLKDRPVEPVVMQSVTIDCREVEAAPPR